MRGAALIGLAAVAGIGVGAWPLLTNGDRSDIIRGCRATDGDTIRCGDERIRLLGIDAPELRGHCRPGRRCVQGDPIASTDSLRAAMTGTLRIVRLGEDRYGRTLGLVSGADGNLSCEQLKRGEAIYRADWDNGGRVAAICPIFAT